MGFALPAAIGAKMGAMEREVVAIIGDGGYQMTIQELGTIFQNKTPVKIVVLNNGHLGMVRQWQELFYEDNYVATTLYGPDFIKIAEAYGIPAIRVVSKTEVAPAIQKAMDTSGPFLIDFRVEGKENVYPMVAPGANIGEITKDPRLDDIFLPGKKR